jgi:hypothetical protein
VDYGFTATRGPQGAVYAVVVRNPNAGWVATNVYLDVAFFDEGGDRVAYSIDLISNIPPSSQMAVGLPAYGGDEATSMEVEFADTNGSLPATGWRPAGPADMGEYSFGTADIQSDSNGQAVVSGEITSHYTVDQQRVEVVGVFYDRDGKIIGGNVALVDDLPRAGAAHFEMSSTFSPADIDHVTFNAQFGYGPL